MELFKGDGRGLRIRKGEIGENGRVVVSVSDGLGDGEIKASGRL